MRSYKILFLLIAVIAAVIGFGFAEGAIAVIAKVFAGIFTVIFAASLLNNGPQSEL